MCEHVDMRPIQAELLDGGALYREVVLGKLAHARESVWIATANVKAMYVEQAGRFVPLLQVLDGLAARGVALRLLHAEMPSRPFRAEFDKRARLVRLWLRLFHVTPREEILRKLELCRPAEEPWTALRILPAHYAFIWQGHSKTVQSLAL